MNDHDDEKAIAAANDDQIMGLREVVVSSYLKERDMFMTDLAAKDFTISDYQFKTDMAGIDSNGDFTMKVSISYRIGRNVIDKKP
jgi:hypothetical protein